ncbi:MAG: hypothetical protein DME23_20155 [Verrucomicrobia bacterium]|nr:MAG: hypothetical protein DME23_20155 [Verrucomicrobiota bacterium]
MSRLNRGLSAVLLLGAVASVVAQPLRVIDPKLYYLGTAGDPEWQEFAGKTPHGRRLDLKFTAQANTNESTLFIRQRDVKLDWIVELNGRKLGKLFLSEQDLVQALTVPAGALLEGENTLAIIPPKERDDIEVGEIKLDSRPPKEALHESTLVLSVSDDETQQPLPARITVTDKSGALFPFHVENSQPSTPDHQPSTINDQPVLALRPGVVYTGSGTVRIGLPAGYYTLYASRGFEYGVRTQQFTLPPGQTYPLPMRIRREVPTPGMVSCDTHVHTFTYSHHGDATVEERMLTLAGEGIELPIATDHDILTDYSEPARRMGVQDYFTPVIGDEVTTEAGHFNIFPVQPGSRVPDHRITDWPRLMEELRATPDVRVVVLNHPRNIHSNFQPFAEKNFNPVTGENRRGFEFSFDAVEVVNSSALQSDLMLTFRDWFALLNYGYRVTAVGSSDCHDVSRYIVGQGRSYVLCDDSNPGKINLEEACRSFLNGRVLVSLGLLTQMTVEDKFQVGDLATGLGELMRVTVTVLGPSWTSADRVELYANGVKIREQQIETPVSPVQKTRVMWIVPKPAYDAYLVAIASGPPVTGAYWPIPKPYQPNSRVWQPRVIGATNPIWVDGDGDGKFTPPRVYAKEIVKRAGSEPKKLIAELAKYDEAVATQVASLCQAAGRDVRSTEFEEALETALQHVRRGFAAYAATLPSK